MTLTQRNKVAGNHLGIQVETKEDVLKHKERLEREGFFAREELNTTCCYAV
ncbi:hypothetical protein J32TS2_41120 [Shouchella clausii]|nr:hypothetical protein J32TS2_41120 [Shouchella clausii]